MVLPKDVEIADVVNMDEAPERLNALTTSTKHSPITIIAVYGHPDNGKTTFCKRVQESWRKENNPWKVMFVDGMEQIGIYSQTSYYLVQIPAEPRITAADDEDLQRKIGRPFDAKVVIVDPKKYGKEADPRAYETMLKEWREECDLVVENPRAEYKIREWH